MHVELDKSGLVQVLPQVHLQAQVVVDEEADRVEVLVVVVVRVSAVVRRHEAVRTHLENTKK